LEKLKLIRQQNLINQKNGIDSREREGKREKSILLLDASDGAIAFAVTAALIMQDIFVAKASKVIEYLFRPQMTNLGVSIIHFPMPGKKGAAPYRFGENLTVYRLKGSAITLLACRRCCCCCCMFALYNNCINFVSL